MNTNKVLFVADTYSFISNEIFGEINKRDVEHNRLNSGCYIGKVEDILNLLVNLCDLFECKMDSNDQNLLTLYYNKCVDCLNIDLNTFYWQYLIATNSYNTIKAPLENKYYMVMVIQIWI